MKIFQHPSFENIYLVSAFYEDLDSIFKKNSKLKKEYREKLLIRLGKLNAEKTSVLTKYTNDFEKLNCADEKLFAIRFDKSKVNLRCIYTYEREKIVLLLAFKEKRSSDYGIAINRAVQVLRNMREGL